MNMKNMKTHLLFTLDYFFFLKKNRLKLQKTITQHILTFVHINRYFSKFMCNLCTFYLIILKILYSNLKLIQQTLIGYKYVLFVFVFLIYKLLSSNYFLKMVQDRYDGVEVFKNSNAKTMHFWQHTVFMYIQENKTIVFSIDTLPQTLNINHQGRCIIQERICCEKIMIIHSIIYFSMNI